MPRIPTYDSRQVEAAPLNGKPQSGLSADMFQGGNSLGQAGKSLSAAGAEVTALAEKQKERDNLQAVLTAETQLINGVTDFEAEAGKRLGANAKGVTQDAGTWWNETVSKIGKDLTPDQQQAFNNIALRRLPTFRASIMAHENRQAEIGLQQAFKAQREASAVAVFTNPMLAPQELENVKRSTQAELLRQGITDKNQRDLAMLEATTGVHVAALGAIEQQSPALALKYLEANQSEIDPVKFAAARNRLSTAATDERVEKINDTFEAQYRGGQITMQQWQDKIRAEHSGKDEDALLKDSVYRSNLVEANKKEIEQKTENAVWGLINKGQSLSQIRKSNEWRSLTDEKQRAQFTEYFVAKAEKARAEAERRQGRLDKIEKNNWETREFVDQAITDGVITDPAQLKRYEPYFTNETLNTFTNKIKKRGEIDPKDVQKAFEDVKGKQRSKWGDSEHTEWQAFQRWIYGKNAELKRPGDVQAWADQWAMKGYGRDDEAFRNDPNTLGEAITAGRKDFVVSTPERDLPGVNEALAVARSAGVKVLDGKLAVDEFYGSYYLDASRYFEANGRPASPQGIAAYAILRQQKKPITPRNIEFVTKQLGK